MKNLIEATGTFIGEDLLIPRIPLMPTDFVFEYKHVQFRVRLAFAMSINKSQGQSLEASVINFELQCFSHGYVACMRVGKPSEPAEPIFIKFCNFR